MLELIVRKSANKTKNTPLLFIHGAWHGAWCWDEHFLSCFAEQGYDVYAPSLRGHGQSSGKDKLRWTSAKDFLADLDKTVAKLPQAPIIIGHSMGGYVVQKYLESNTLPGGILLASAPPKGVLGTALRIARHFPREFIKMNLTMSLYPLVQTPVLAQKQFFSAGMPQEKTDRYFNLLGDESYRAFLDMLLFNLPKPERVKTPILVLGANHDTVFLEHEVKATARAYNTEPYFFPMAHDMMLEDGWEKVAAKMIEWLDEKKLD